MNILVLLESGYNRSPWCKKILDGLYDECLKHNQTIKTVDFDEYIENSAVYHADNKDRPVIVIGMTAAFLKSMAATSQSLDVQFLLLNYRPEFPMPNVHCLLLDFSHVMYELLTQLFRAGKKHPAMVGVNRESYNETVKKDCYQTVLREQFGHSSSENSVFYFDSSIEDCFESFYQSRDRFDSIICANDFVAVYFIKELKKRGIYVPHDIYVSSFIDTNMGKIYASSITSVSIKYSELGKQAIHLYNFLQKAKHFSPLTVYMSCQIDQAALRKQYLSISAGQEAVGPISFYSDPNIEIMRRIELFLERCDSTDIRILQGILQNHMYKTIAMDCFISESTVKYRVKTLLSKCGMRTKKEMAEYLASYLGKDSPFYKWCP